jgi:hypothetical protein
VTGEDQPAVAIGRADRDEEVELGAVRRCVAGDAHTRAVQVLADEVHHLAIAAVARRVEGNEPGEEGFV